MDPSAGPSIPSTAINRLPTFFKPRRRRPHITSVRATINANRRRRRIERRQRADEQEGQGQRRTDCEGDEGEQDGTCNGSAEVNDEEEDDEKAISSLATITDTHVAILTLHSQWPGQASVDLPRTPPIILRSQIHALVTDPTIIHYELDLLIHNNVIRHIRIPSTFKSNELCRDAYILTQEFQQRLASLKNLSQRESALLTTFYTSAFQNCTSHLIAKYQLEVIFQDYEVESVISLLVRRSLLLMMDENTYAFTVPGMSVFVAHRESGDKQIIQLLKSSRYNEMPLSDMQLRTLKKTMFTAQWHVRDVVGSGIARTVSTTIGNLVRLRR